MKVICMSISHFKFWLYILNAIQFFSRGMHIHIALLTAVQNEHESHRKDSIYY